MEKHDRVRAVREYYGLSPEEFAKKLALTLPQLADVESGAKKLGFLASECICTQFDPQISRKWLKRGEGEMLRIRKTTVCSVCKQEFVSEYTMECPYCGAVNPPQGVKIAANIFAFIVVFVIFLLFGLPMLKCTCAVFF
jgi:hypothetical protein